MAGDGRSSRSNSKWVVYVKEVKTVSLVAAPMVAAILLQSLVYVVSTIMVGHLDDQLSLSAVSIAFAFSLVTGFTLLAGMAGGLETLCGQAYGAEQYHKLATYTYSAITTMAMVSVPISILWLFTDKLLILAGQDHAIAKLARSYSICLIPGLFAFGLLQSMIRFLQTQSLILPMLFSSLASTCVHVPLCWVLVFKTRLGCIGAGLSTSVSIWVNVILLGTYMACSPKCARTLAKFRWKDMVVGSWEFLRFAVPSAIMTCLEWWSFDVLILLSGLLPNPKVETSVLSICFSIFYLHSTISVGFAATISTRVSNELGARNPKAAKLAMKVVMVLLMIELVVVILPLLFFRHILGYAFSSDKEIVDHVAIMVPFLCLSSTMDALQAVLSGVVRGSGKQKLGAFVNLGAYYLVGTPLAAILAFVAHLGGKGLLVGISTGSCLQASIFGVTIILTNWEQMASKSRERIFQGGEPQGL